MKPVKIIEDPIYIHELRVFMTFSQTPTGPRQYRLLTVEEYENLVIEVDDKIELTHTVKFEREVVGWRKWVERLFQRSSRK